MAQDTKFRPGVRESEFLPVPGILLQKTHKRFNVLVGDDPVQVRFAEFLLNTPAVEQESLKDENFLGQEGNLLYHIRHIRHLDVSDNVKPKIGIWSLNPIVRGSAAASSLVRFAAQLQGGEFSKERLKEVADEITKEESNDLRATLWRAVWLLTDPHPEPFKPWPAPWETTTGWLPKGVDPSYRLHSLYRDIVAYTFTRNPEWEEGVRKAGVNLSPSKLKVVKGWKLDARKVHDTYYELCRWRCQRYDAYVAALKITNIWSAR